LRRIAQRGLQPALTLPKHGSYAQARLGAHGFP
jgi:hypothetical protein